MKNNIENIERRKSLALLTLGTSTAIINCQAQTGWFKPTISSITLPVHAQTSDLCGEQNLIMNLTMDDLSDLSLEFYELGSGGSLLSEITLGSIMGSGTIEALNACIDPESCYEIVFRTGSGHREVLLDGVIDRNEAFTSVSSFTLGSGCQ